MQNPQSFFKQGNKLNLQNDNDVEDEEDYGFQEDIQMVKSQQSAIIKL
jgi:hypothetical protein